MSDRSQTQADLRTADQLVHAVWDNFIKTEPTYVLRDLIVIELEKARAAEREACAKIADDWAENTGLHREAPEGIAKEIRARGETKA